MKFVIFITFLAAPLFARGQEAKADLDSLKAEILSLRKEVEKVQVNLVTSEKKFKRGILVATIGYSVTIAGGLMLGRRQDELGKGLLIAGGATGITGTALMLDSFKYLGRAGKK